MTFPPSSLFNAKNYTEIPQTYILFSIISSGRNAIINNDFENSIYDRIYNNVRMII